MKFSKNIALIWFILAAIILITVNADPIPSRSKRAYDYTPPEDGAPGLFDDEGDDDGGNSVSASFDDGNGNSGYASASSFDTDFEKPEYTPKCCAHCTCT